MLQYFKAKKTLWCTLICSFIFIGCYYDIEEELYPSNTACNVTNIRYSTTITSLLNRYGCLSCHGGGVRSGNISLETHTDVKRKVDDGSFWGAINHMPGFSPMPQAANKMNSCDISTIKAWIDAGSPNN